MSISIILPLVFHKSITIKHDSADIKHGISGETDKPPLPTKTAATTTTTTTTTTAITTKSKPTLLTPTPPTTATTATTTKTKTTTIMESRSNDNANGNKNDVDDDIGGGGGGGDGVVVVRKSGSVRRMQRLRKEILNVVDETIRSGTFYVKGTGGGSCFGNNNNGEEEEEECRGGCRVTKIERKLSKITGSPVVVATNSGTSALQLALMSSNVGGNDEVIVPASTFVSTAYAVWSVGATPVFVDVDPDTLCIDPVAVREAITPKTRAIVPVHMHGRMADVRSILKIVDDEHDRRARRRNNNNNEQLQTKKIVVVEDAAQAIGCCDHRHQRQQHAGTIGDYGCISLWSGKSVGGIEDAGVVLCKHPQLERGLRRLTNLGRDPPNPTNNNNGNNNCCNNSYDVHQEYGLRARLGQLNASVIDLQLDRLDEYIEKRRKIAEFYDDSFSDLVVGGQNDFFFQPLGWKTRKKKEEKDPGDSGVENKTNNGGGGGNDFVEERQQQQHAYYKYAVKLGSSKERELFEGTLRKAGIETERVYNMLVPDHPAFAASSCNGFGGSSSRRRKHRTEPIPNARSTNDRVTCLPIYPELTENEIERVVNTVREYFLSSDKNNEESNNHTTTDNNNNNNNKKRSAESAIRYNNNGALSTRKKKKKERDKDNDECSSSSSKVKSGRVVVGGDQSVDAGAKKDNHNDEDHKTQDFGASKKSTLKEESVRWYAALAQKHPNLTEVARLGWSSRESQRKRFERLFDVVTSSSSPSSSPSSFSILDVGCGVGDFYQYLLDRGYGCRVEYVGCDIVSENVVAARQRFEEATTAAGVRRDNGTTNGGDGAAFVPQKKPPTFLACDVLDMPAATEAAGGGDDNAKNGGDKKEHGVNNNNQRRRRYTYVVASGIFALDGRDWDRAVSERLSKMLSLCKTAMAANFLSSHAVPSARLNGYHYVEPSRVARLCGDNVTSSFVLHHDSYSHKKNDMTLVGYHERPPPNNA